jgi:hypothetical protein
MRLKVIVWYYLLPLCNIFTKLLVQLYFMAIEFHEKHIPLIGLHVFCIYFKYGNMGNFKYCIHTRNTPSLLTAVADKKSIEMWHIIVADLKSSTSTSIN